MALPGESRPQDVKTSMKPNVQPKTAEPIEEPVLLQKTELGRIVQSTGSVLEKNATTIVAVICTVLVVAAGGIWWARQSTETSSAAWALLESAESVDDFGSISEKFANAIPGQWAKLRESEAHQKSGTDVMFTDRELALADFKRAREGFEKLVAAAGVDPIIRERALWGLARALEATSDGDTAKSSDAYQRLIADFPETIYKPFAEERIASLKTGGTKEFYAWFSKQNPKPADIRPKDGAAKNPHDLFLPPAAAGEIDDKTKDADAKPGDEAGAAKPDPAKAAAPKVEEPKAEEPKADAAKEDSASSKPDEPKTEKKVDEPAAEKKLGADEPKAESKPEAAADAPAEKKPE